MRAASNDNFTRATKARPCPICGKQSYCGWYPTRVVCTSPEHAAGGKRKVSRGGDEYWVHPHPDATLPPPRKAEREKAAPPTPVPVS